MEILIVSSVAFLASLLTLFSGFGLGTLLMPVVAIFFSIDVAVAVTAVVHLANNLFKVGLLGRHVHKEVLFRFGVPAVLAAFVGAFVLAWLAKHSAQFKYQIFSFEFSTNVLQFTVGLIILIFVVLELTQYLKSKRLDKKYLPLGGLISGFFGGLSGHQGAFRSMFLLKTGLTKEQFVATGVMVAVLVDMARLAVYGVHVSTDLHSINWNLVLAATFSAFVGAYLGKRLLEKITIKTIQLMVSVLLLVVALGLMTGVI